jgi:hypothetical protein
MKRMVEVPEELDWVGAHAACTVARVFRELLDGVEGDVRAINLARKLSSDSCFRVDRGDADRFMVRRGESIRPVVTFWHGVGAIYVNDEVTANKFTIALTISASGRCVLKVDGVEMERWQARKMALEVFFFSESNEER